MTLAARINRGFGRAQGPSVGSKTLPSREETFRRPKRYSYTNRLKSQIKHVIMWHYIFAKYLTRSNNINDLQLAGRPLLLKISIAFRGPRFHTLNRANPKKVRNRTTVWNVETQKCMFRSSILRRSTSAEAGMVDIRLAKVSVPLQDLLLKNTVVSECIPRQSSAETRRWSS